MKKAISVILAVLLIPVLSGCTQGEKLNDLTVVQAVALDSENGEVLFTVQYLDLNRGTGKNEGLNSSLTANAQGCGSTLEKAYNNLEKTVPDKLFFGQAKLLIIGEEYLDTHSAELEKVLKNGSKYRVDMLVAKSEKAYEVLECGFRNERVPIDGICKKLKSENRLVTVNDYLGNAAFSLPEIVISSADGYVK